MFCRCLRSENAEAISHIDGNKAFNSRREPCKTFQHVYAVIKIPCETPSDLFRDKKEIMTQEGM